MNLGDVLEHIIEPTLATLEARSDAAVLQVLGTGVAESKWSEISQQGGGPARSPLQMEGATHDDIRDNFLAYRPELAERVRAAAGMGPATPLDARWLAGNWYYAVAFCRVHYMRETAPIPETLAGQAAYWKAHYNTPAGAGTVEHYLDAWRGAGLEDF